MQRPYAVCRCHVGARRLTYQELEQRLVLTSVTLELREVVRVDQEQMDGFNLADFNGDGNVDWLTALSPVDHGRWHSNLALFVGDGRGNFELSHLINPESDQERPVSIFSVGDLDGDGDHDIVSLSAFELFWDENVSAGIFERHLIVADDPNAPAGTFEFCESLFNSPTNEYILVIDYDGDRDLDIVSNHEACSSGFENLGGGEFIPRKDFAIDVSGNTTALDWQDDGDIDFVSVGSLETTLLVNDGAGNLDKQPLSHSQIGDWGLFDLDGDGTRELVSSSVYSSVIATSGIELPFNTPNSRIAVAANLDGDEFLDHFVVQSRIGLGSSITMHWVEDTLVTPVFHQAPAFRGNELVPQSMYGYFADFGRSRPSMEVIDVDEDGDDDFLAHLVGCSAQGRGQCLIVIENHLTGDADDDNTVDFADFLSLSANFGKSADAVWEDGDFNLDGTINFADFLLLSAAFGETRG